MTGRQPARRRVGVLISGRGSNLQALLAAAAAPDYPAEIAVVISNRADAGGLAFAETAGVANRVIDHRAYSGREAFEAEVTDALAAHDVELVAQAGFMRIVTASFIARWWNRMINIHPSLLPSFPGLETHARALAAGVKLHGCSVHFVREVVDQGPIIGQAAVPVLAGDDPDSLAARVLRAEHRLYPHCLRLVAENRVTIEDERCIVAGPDRAEGSFFNPDL
ncbi:MAG TPA: phosphoribosylglycinamide formyltransferase [Kiloniellaceae bacterium]|nr:phosphoribosylglycinamide formyltransferase [Kiloniellaceae bacterium]